MLRYALFTALILATGFVCYDLGERGARAYERMQVSRIQNGLGVIGLDWARIQADGLRIELHGHAPDPFARELALESARATAPLARVRNYATATLAPPEHRDPVRIELHRDERGVTLTGQTASREMRARLNRGLTRADAALEVRDLTGIQAAAPPQGWGAEIDVATLAAAALPNAYVVVEPGLVAIRGSVADATERDALAARLTEVAGASVSLAFDVDIPPRVITPFAFAASKTPGQAIRLERCASPDADAQGRILGALARHGADPHPGACPTGLGGPERWADAVLAALDVLAGLPAGRLDVEYRAARLTGEPPTPPARFETAAAAFAETLPEGFAASTALRSEDVATRTGLVRERHWMRLANDETGLTLSGDVPDATARTAIITYAAAHFGADRVRNGLRPTDRPAPAGWQSAALRLIEALGAVEAGVAELAGHRARLTATLGTPEDAVALHEALAASLPDYRLETRLTVDLPGAIAAIALPPRACADLLARIMSDMPIDFESGSAVITPESRGVLDALAAGFARCNDEAIEVGGHTDSKGSQDLNQRLSTARAQAVVTALVNRGVAIDRLEARGYGESLPIADNDTPAGRARNRRIEFLPGQAPEPAPSPAPAETDG